MTITYNPATKNAGYSSADFFCDLQKAYIDWSFRLTYEGSMHVRKSFLGGVETRVCTGMKNKKPGYSVHPSNKRKA